MGDADGEGVTVGDPDGEGEGEGDAEGVGEVDGAGDADGVGVLPSPSKGPLLSELEQAPSASARVAIKMLPQLWISSEDSLGSGW